MRKTTQADRWIAELIGVPWKMIDDDDRDWLAAEGGRIRLLEEELARATQFSWGLPTPKPDAADVGP